MPRYEYAKMSVEEAMNLYEEAQETTCVNSVSGVDESAIWYEAWQLKRVDMQAAYAEKRAAEEYEAAIEATELMYEVDAFRTAEEADMDVVPATEEVVETFPQKNRNKRRERRMTHLNKSRKQRNTAKIVCDSYSKRMSDDMFWTSSRGGIIRKRPKCKTLKADHLLKRAAKKQLFEAA